MGTNRFYTMTHQFSSWIRLKGCRQHNLKNFSLSLPKQAITVLTGVSGSGKSSLAFDTLFAEGQRRYLEYLSSQARTWIKQMAKPNVDLIEGLSPTLAVGQGRFELFSRGTVATYTDIYDFLALLYANIGEQHSPVTGKRLIRYSRQEIIHLILKEYPIGTKLQLLAPIKLHRENAYQAITRLQQMGFIRLKIQEEEWTSEMPLPPLESITQLDVVVDRLEMKEEIRERLAPSVETALDLSQGILKVQEGRTGPIRYFTEIYVCPETSHAFAPLEPVDFNFNSPRGACPICQGLGGQEAVNRDLLFDDQQSTLLEQVRLILDHIPRRIMTSFQEIIQLYAKKNGIQEETTLQEIPSPLLEEFLYGSSQVFEISTIVQGESQYLKTTWQGLIPFLNRLLQDRKSKGSLSELPFVEWKVCPACQGARLKPESLACLIQGKNIDTLCEQTVSQLLKEIQSWNFGGKEALIAKEILPDIQTRLHFLEQVGLGYLELNRQGKTLSDGEAQRIQLASQIGAKLSGLIYILDEPSLGLHRQDIQYLQQVIQELKQLGNTIVLVEHERGLISQADHIVELGPGAGEHGGHITFQGTFSQLLKDTHSLTGQWLSGRKTFPKPPRRKPKQGWLQVKNVSLHNIHHLSLKIPLGCLVGFCGVSGSGKSTLALDLIGNAMHQYLTHHTSPPFLEGYESIQRLVMGQKLTERFSARSIPATYVDIMTPLRQLFAETRLAKARGYTASRFSLNKRGGRCEACEGLGELRVNMQLMPDLFIPCDVCQGARYNYETLQVTWENRNIAEVLALSVDEALSFFRYIPSLTPTLELMQELGLGYLTLGQHFHTLSGGEIQRLKLVADLISKSQLPTLYILDEPSAGLHFEDVQKLMMILQRLVDKGHSIFVIEHHLGLLQQADWLIELGPEGGPQGGKLIFEGTAQQLAKASTPTGKIISEFIS
jgi:excinuclease ABC subunit A